MQSLKIYWIRNEKLKKSKKSKNKLINKKFSFITFISSWIFLNQFVLADISFSNPAVVVGAKSNIIDAENSISNGQVLSYQAGFSIIFDFGSGQDRDFGLKTGLMYHQRGFENDLTTTRTQKGQLNYIDIPLQLMFRFEDYAGIFFGPSVAFKISDECKISDTVSSDESCNLNKVSSIIYPLTFGAQFELSTQFGLSLFFESIASQLTEELKSSRAAGLNIFFVFE